MKILHNKYENLKLKHENLKKNIKKKQKKWKV